MSRFLRAAWIWATLSCLSSCSTTGPDRTLEPSARLSRSLAQVGAEQELPQLPDFPFEAIAAIGSALDPIKRSQSVADEIDSTVRTWAASIWRSGKRACLAATVRAVKLGMHLWDWHVSNSLPADALRSVEAWIACPCATHARSAQAVADELRSFYYGDFEEIRRERIEAVRTRNPEDGAGLVPSEFALRYLAAAHVAQAALFCAEAAGSGDAWVYPDEDWVSWPDSPSHCAYAVVSITSALAIFDSIALSMAEWLTRSDDVHATTRSTVILREGLVRHAGAARTVLRTIRSELQRRVQS